MSKIRFFLKTASSNNIFENFNTIANTKCRTQYLLGRGLFLGITELPKRVPNFGELSSVIQSFADIFASDTEKLTFIRSILSRHCLLTSMDDRDVDMDWLPESYNCCSLLDKSASLSVSTSVTLSAVSIRHRRPTCFTNLFDNLNDTNKKRKRKVGGQHHEARSRGHSSPDSLAF